jgi:hypothetical protein
MAKAGRKTQEMRHVSFRMPADVHRDYVTIAEARGTDLSAVLNWVLVEHRPALLLRHANHKAAMLRAALADPQQGEALASDPAPALDQVNDLIRQLQEVSAQLLKKAAPRQAG